MFYRRTLLGAIGGAATAACLGQGSANAQLAGGTSASASAFAPFGGPRSRVLLVNDLSGDIDGLFATVHQILTPTAELRGIVGTSAGSDPAARSAELAREMLALMGTARVPVYEGAAA